MAEVRLCIKCEQPVREVQPGTGKQYGIGEVSSGFVHKADSYNGIPNCGRQFLQEHETYTEQLVARRDNEF